MMLNSKFQSYQRTTVSGAISGSTLGISSDFIATTNSILPINNANMNNMNSNPSSVAHQHCGVVELANVSTATAPSAAGSASPASSTKAERESIHSGQFMVSHFEAEEAQDDLEDDGEVKMLDPEDPSLSKPDDEPNPCLEVQLYVPHKVAHLQRGGQGYGADDAADVSMVTSHLEIETSLTKLFKCMNLAYSQKLTSPKWNHFKGVRLRWKDKIRLNNVIWRCWHMQFILKRRTPVCQFASPLDVDIHSNPQTVVLEGKYWKRQLAVIKAEYRKWRKNYKSKATGCLTFDTKSEFDFLEWSPLNDRNLMLSEDWTSDTLFSAINGPFPFPDPREIARGAGIADFIQPSLGPLQPNLDDIDITFADLLQNSRLPPVPEEGTDEMLKSSDYGFSAIMGTEQMDSTNMMDVGPSNVVVGTNDDANMIELNTPISNIQFSDIEQQFATRGVGGDATTNLMSTQVPANVGTSGMMAADQRTLASMLMSELPNVLNTNSNGSGGSSNNNSGGLNRSPSASSKYYSGSNENLAGGRQCGSDFSGKSVINGRISKPFQRPFSYSCRREPHNYDKAQPTLHQTSIYQQMLAEQQKGHHQHLQPNMSSGGGGLQHQTFQTHTQAPTPQQQRLHFPTQQFGQTTTSSFGTAIVSGGGSGFQTNNEQTASVAASINNNLLNLPANAIATDNKNFALMQQQANNVVAAVRQQQQQQQQQLMLNVKVEPNSQQDLLSLFNLSNDSYSNTSNSYKPYPNLSHFKKSASTGTFINVPRVTVNMQQQQQQSNYMQDQTQQQQQQQLSVQQQQQQQLSVQQQQQQTAAVAMQQSLPLTLGSHAQLLTRQSSVQLAQQIVTSQQQQQQQMSVQLQSTATTQSSNLMPKEMFRSNSLPLNVTLQKFDARSVHEQFAVPKYHSKSSKSRVRSNSIHQHMVNNAATSTPASVNSAVTSCSSSNLSSSNLLVTPQLQPATSDPMLNSTLAQLLTTSSRTLVNNKQQSSSTSAISNLNIVPPAGMSTTLPLPISTVAQSSKVQTSVSLPISQNFMSLAQNSTSSSPLMVGGNVGGVHSVGGVISTGGSAAPASPKAHEFLQRQQQQPQKSPKKSASLPTPVTTPILHSPPANKMLSYPLAIGQHPTSSSSTILSLSPDSFQDQDSPLSPTHSLKFPRDTQRRAGHIHAEQKRRSNIKYGFDMLHSLIPQLQQNPNAKFSKAAMLQKGADHIKHLRAERNVLKEKMESLRMERDALNNSLTHLHSILPANGAPVTRQGTEHVRQLYEQYVRYRTMNNWKFWILGLILEPLLASYTASVSSASMDELRRTAFLWVDQHCSLIDLRPAVSNKLKYLSMKTDILSDPPSTLQEEVDKALNNTNSQHPNLHGT